MIRILKFIIGTRSTWSDYSIAQIAAYIAWHSAAKRWRAEWVKFSAATEALGLPSPNCGLIYGGHIRGLGYGSGVPLFWTPVNSPLFGTGEVVRTMKDVFGIHGITVKQLADDTLAMATISPAQFWDNINLPYKALSLTKD